MTSPELLSVVDNELPEHRERLYPPTWTRQTQTPDNTQILFMLIAQQKIGNRPGRTEPKAVKRRPKPFSLLMTPRDKLKAGTMKYTHNGRLK